MSKKFANSVRIASKKSRVSSQYDLPAFQPRARFSLYGSARFATRHDLTRFLRKKYNVENSTKLTGVTLLLEDVEKNDYDVLKNHDLYFPRDVLERNIMVTGQIGSGKTQKIMYPLVYSSLADPEKSLVILGTKGDEYDVIRAICEKVRPNAKIECLNLADASRSTVGWNPFAGGGSDRISNAYETAETLLKTQQSARSNNNDFFFKNAIRAVAGMIYYLELVYGAARASDLFKICCDRENMLKFFEVAKKNKTPLVNDFYDKVTSGSGYDHNAATILTEVSGNLAKLADSNLATVLSSNDFNFDMLFDEPTVLVLEAPQDLQVKTGPFLAIFFRQLFSAISERARKNQGVSRLPRRLMMFMDDFTTSVGRINDMGNALNMMRSSGVEVVLALQSREQIEQNYSYSEAYAILNACATKIYVAQVGMRDASYASEESGDTTIALCPTTSNDEEDGSNGTARPYDEAPQRRNLLVPDEIVHSPKHKVYGLAATFFLAEERPFQAWLPKAATLPGLKEAFEKAKSYPGRTPKPGSQLESNLYAFKRGLPPEQDAVKDLFTPNFVAKRKTIKPVEERVEERRKEAAYQIASLEAKEWWSKFERVFKNKLEAVERYLLKVIKRKLTIQELYDAHVLAETNNMDALISYLDYSALKKREEETLKRRAEAKLKKSSSANAA